MRKLANALFWMFLLLSIALAVTVFVPLPAVQWGHYSYPTGGSSHWSFEHGTVWRYELGPTRSLTGYSIGSFLPMLLAYPVIYGIVWLVLWKRKRSQHGFPVVPSNSPVASE